MDRTPEQILDDSIIDPMPPFPTVQHVIGRERRRQRVRRGAGVLVAAVTVAAIVVGIQAGLGPAADGPPVRPGQSGPTGSSSNEPTTGPRTVDQIGADLVRRLSDRLSSQVPGLSGWQLNGAVLDPFPGYDGYHISGSVRTSAGTGMVGLLALWPQPGAATPPGGSELPNTFGCAGLSSLEIPPIVGTEGECEERTDEVGSRIVLAQRRDATNLAYIVIVHYTDGTVLRLSATNNPSDGLSEPVFSLSDLRRLLGTGELRP